MAFDDFERAIHSPHLKAVARHWNAARGTGLMPAWADLKPSCIAGQLSIIWSYVYDPSTDEFRGRLAGDRIVQVISRNIRGVALKDVHPETFPWLQGMLHRVANEAMAFRSAGPVYKQAARLELGERIVLPLGRGGVADGVLGATEYHRAQFVPGVAIEPVAPKEEWYALRQTSPVTG